MNAVPASPQEVQETSSRKEQSKTSKLAPPVSYQGGKQRLASQILDKIALDPSQKFYDLCCGSGAVSLELVNRGHSPSLIRMVDAGPWGMFWESIGAGTFDLDVFERYVNAVPSDVSKIQQHVKELSAQPVGADAPYVFLLLQASSFGGKAIWQAGGQWRNCSFRSYWLPTATSSRRSPVNPMMPMPLALLRRVEALVPALKGMQARCCDVASVRLSPNSVAYIDPPYDGTTGYGHVLDYKAYAPSQAADVWVSEGKQLTDTAFPLLKDGSSKGGISGDRGKFCPEWLSLYRRAA